MPFPHAAVSAVRASDRARGEQIAQCESLGYGVALCAPRFPTLSSANRLREVWLAEVGAEAAYRQAEEYYGARGLTCWAWAPAAAQPVEPLEALLRPLSWRRVDYMAMGLASGDARAEVSAHDFQILPARAVHRMYAASFDPQADPRGERHEEVVEAALSRLEDSNFDEFVAIAEHRPLGRMGYLEVGDIARLEELYVLPAFREQGVGGELMRHFLRLARRLSPRVVAAAVESDDVAGRAFLERFGFVAAGTLSEFRRPRE